MENKKVIDVILKLLEEETKRIKKKKKVSAPMLRRPLGSIFSMDVGVSESTDLTNTSDLEQQVKNSRNLDEFLRNIITDYDVRYKNRKAAQSLVKDISVDFVDDIKPFQKIEQEMVSVWEEIIRDGKRPFIIITNNGIDGHHKLEAYKQLGFKIVPVLFVEDLINFYQKHKNATATLSEGLAIKPITKKFDTLKWKLTDFQKQFLDDFISIADEDLKPKDYEYASTKTGIPVSNIKSIKNTFGVTQNNYLKPDVIKDSVFDASHVGPTYSEFNIEPFYRNDIVNFKTITPDKLKVLKKTTKQKKLETSGYDAEGGLVRSYEKKLPEFMYEWIMYFVEGKKQLKIKESKVLDRAFASRKIRYVSLELEPVLKESEKSSMDYDSNKKTGDIAILETILEEFNSTFGTNFIVENLFMKENGCVKIFLENFQTTDGENTFNRKSITMPSIEKIDPKKLAQQFKDMTLNIKSLQVDWKEFLNA